MITRTEYEGLQGIELRTGNIGLIAVAEFGPRIAFLGRPGGSNLLYWRPGLHLRGEWDLRGGHRVWTTTPLADESEYTYRPDNQPCEVQVEADRFTLLGAEDPVNRTRRGLTVAIRGETFLEVDNFVVNTGDMLCSGGVWALTCTVPTPGSQYVVPVGDGSSWDTFNMVFFRQWAGHGQNSFADSQVEIGHDQVVLRPQGQEIKRMLQAHPGIIAMSDTVNDLTFAKQAEFDPAGRYPHATNIAFYVGPDNFMVEMETMGVEKTLKPGAELHHRELWTLQEGAQALNSAAETKALFASAQT